MAHRDPVSVPQKIALYGGSIDQTALPVLTREADRDGGDAVYADNGTGLGITLVQHADNHDEPWVAGVWNVDDLAASRAFDCLCCATRWLRNTYADLIAPPEVVNLHRDGLTAQRTVPGRGIALSYIAASADYLLTLSRSVLGGEEPLDVLNHPWGIELWRDRGSEIFQIGNGRASNLTTAGQTARDLYDEHLRQERLL